MNLPPILQSLGGSAFLIPISSALADRGVAVNSAGTAWAARDLADASLLTRGLIPLARIEQADATHSGYVSSTDWNAFNNKGSGNGSVTSVALSAPAILSVAGSPVTTSGTLTLSLAIQTANQVFVGPASGGAIAPTFRSLVSNDIPSLDTSKIGTGVFSDARLSANIPRIDSPNVFTAGQGINGSLYVGRVSELDTDSFPALRMGSDINGLIDGSPLSIRWDASTGKLKFVTENDSGYPVYIDQLATTTVSGSGAGLTNLPAASLTGTIATARLGSGSATSSTFLRGDQAWATTGTVTSVAASVPSWLAIAGSPITTSGTLAFSSASALAANQVLATPSGISGTLTLRSLVALDMPAIAESGVTGLVTDLAAKAAKIDYIPLIQSATFDNYVVANADGTVADSTIPFGRIKSGAALVKPAIGGVFYASTTSTGNATTTETDLFNTSIAGSLLTADKSSLTFVNAGQFAATINNKRLRVYFGATTIFDSGALAITAATDYTMYVEIIRVDATHQKATVTLSTSNATLSAYSYYSEPGETLTNDITFRITGTATANNDIVGKFCKGYYEPSP